MTLKEYIRTTLKTYIKIYKNHFAEKDGDPTQTFKVAQPSANYDAVNMQYADNNYISKTTEEITESEATDDFNNADA
jgi:hypothetical protein